MKINYNFKKVLVPLDSSKNSIRALSNAIQLAKQTDASIIEISVIQSFPTEMGLMKTIVGKALSKHYKHFMQIARECVLKKV